MTQTRHIDSLGRQVHTTGGSARAEIKNHLLATMKKDFRLSDSSVSALRRLTLDELNELAIELTWRP